MTFVLAVVCEARADRDTACVLADRVLLESAPWIEKEELDYHRQWCGLRKNDLFLAWKDVSTLARQENIRPHPSFDGGPIAPDAHAARRALLLLKMNGDFPDLVLFIRDDDTDTRRRVGLEQARQWAETHHRLVNRIVIGLAHPKRECWVLAGFDSKNDEERKLLESVRSELGFDPCTEAEQLTAKHYGDKRSAKRILSLLTKGDQNREADCWNTALLPLLRERGQYTGLADYLQELEKFLVPLFAPRKMDTV
jgi:hypothetical protein